MNSPESTGTQAQDFNLEEKYKLLLNLIGERKSAAVVFSGGVDAARGMAHRVVATAANEADREKAGELIRKDDDAVYGDNGYQGLENRPEMREDGQLSGVECRINGKKGADRKREKEICGDPMGHLEYPGEPNWDHK